MTSCQSPNWTPEKSPFRHLDSHWYTHLPWRIQMPDSKTFQTPLWPRQPSGISSRCPSLMARQGRLARLLAWFARLEVQHAQLGLWHAELASVDFQLAQLYIQVESWLVALVAQLEVVIILLHASLVQLATAVTSVQLVQKALMETTSLACVTPTQHAHKVYRAHAIKMWRQPNKHQNRQLCEQSQNKNSICACCNKAKE